VRSILLSILHANIPSERSAMAAFCVFESMVLLSMYVKLGLQEMAYGPS
jgi:hypothetical protein